MKRYLALGAALLAMSACNNSGGGNETKEGGNTSSGAEQGNAAASAGGPATGGERTASAGANDRISPGLWEITMRMNMNMPGVAEGVNRPPETRRECITPEETQRMSENFLESREGQQCSQREFTMRGGRMQARMVCTEQGREMRVSMTGEYSATTFNFRQEMSGTMPGAQTPMSAQIQAQGRRISEQCPPESQEREEPARGGRTP